RRGDSYTGPVFSDSDLYKVLEAIAWDRAHGPVAEHEQFFDQAVELLSRAQLPSGYLHSYVQVRKPDRPFSDPETDHELYCAGHLIQAAVADRRTGGNPTLEGLTKRLIEYLAGALTGPHRTYLDGHPEIETALVEWYRTDGEQAHLGLATTLLDRRGHNTLIHGRFPPAYFQDDIPVEDTTIVRGHAVRALYLGAGAVDAYTETGRERLLATQLAQWEDMVSAKTYLTGGVGSRHLDESFGDPYELPPDRAYCETCAAIASIQWSWRLLLVTGEARFADLIERTLYNGFLSGIGLDGRSFFYVNPLQARDPRTAGRQPWYTCACCPPNIMRLLASVEHYLATTSPGALQLHQYVPCQLRAAAPDGREMAVTVETGYPWTGQVLVRVDTPPDGPFALELRVPAWAPSLSVAVNQQGLAVEPDGRGYVAIRREWRAGDEVSIELPVRPRLTYPSPRIDASRGSVAVERGPLVYCVEGIDTPKGSVLDIGIPASAAVGDGPVMTIGGTEVVGVDIDARVADRGADAWPYAATPPDSGPGPDGTDVALRAVPYFARANRGARDMRVWIPSRR
ncbi:MAG TPA: beta-L-arabinofuranosidase domain-containing protein, partial [Acidimicrobiales bacterium]|nr:beta-L-arabinofuranosidase domain-containing protein [Acidimicrobiales bacterium]